MNTRKAISLILILAMLLTCLAGCGDGEEQVKDPMSESSTTSAAVEVPKAKYAYRPTYLPLTTDQGGDMEWIQNFCISGSSMYYVGSYNAGMVKAVDELGEPIMDPATGKQLEYEETKEGIFRMDLDTGKVEAFSGYAPREIPEGYEGYSGINAMVAGTDGTIWLMEETSTYYYDLPEDFDPETQNTYEYYVPGETYRDLTQYSAEGEKLRSVSLDLTNDGQEIYFSRLMTDSKGYFYACDYEKVYLLDPDGHLLAALGSENGYFNDMAQLSADEVGILEYDQAAQTTVFRPIDPEAKAFGEAMPLCTDIYSLYPGAGEYRYLYSDSDNVYGYAEGAEAGEKLFSWLECDVDSNNVDQFVFLTDGRVAAVERNWSSEDNSCSLILMEQVDASTLPQKQELVLGCMYLDYNLRTMIVEFNRAHDDVRIVVKDYSEYMQDGTYEDALQKLNTEILSGSMPDLLCTNNLPVERYAAKGLLVDLWPMIDGDGELSRDDLMTHLFEVLSDDGKLYQVADSFNIQTAACNGSVAQGRTSWTLEEMLEALNSLQPGAGIFGETDTKADMLTQCLSYNLNNFMDWNTGTCSFDSQAFIDILNFANSFPDEAPANYDWETAESEYSRLMTGKQLMNTIYLGSFEEIQVQAAYHGGDVAFIGFPTSGSGSGSCFTLNTAMAISATCAAPDAAWAFVRQLLLEETQTSGYIWGFPSNRHAFEAAVEQAMTAQYEIDPATGLPMVDPETGEKIEISNSGYGIGDDFMIDVYSMKQNEYDAFMALYESCGNLHTSDDSVMDIIAEEAAAFFAGQKTAEATAAMIQDRLGLYMAEQG